MIYLLPHSLLAAAARYPDREAFRCGGQGITYADLARKVQQLANVLRDEGVAPGDRVGIFLNRSLESALAIYGVLRAGAVYVPLNPKAPPEHQRFVLEDCGIQVLITNPAMSRNLRRLSAEGALTQVRCMVGTDELAEGVTSISWETVFAASATEWTPAQGVETDLAYIIYTSGSTGRPKGIMHTHASGLAFAHNAVARYGLGPEDRFGNHAPIFFDISQLAYFGAPLVGATAVIATDAETIFPTSLARMIARERITVWYSVPLALSQLLQSEALAAEEPKALHHVFYAGEPLAPKYARQLMNRLPGIRLGNWYGPAETNVCTCYDLPGPPVTEEPIPIGEVWQNTERLIVDDQGKEVASGESGELLIRSSTMMLGYWNRPERTAASWHLRPRPGREPERFYRTGDLVREDAQGLLHFVGRRDHQVKVRGYRVELGAIERYLLTHPAVGEAVALTLQENEEALTLLAAVLPEGEAAPTEGELLLHLRRHLPWYALPTTIRIRDHFPRTGTDKVDRPALRELLRQELSS